MQYGGNRKRVKLTVDLTKYDDRCTKGSEGYTIPNGKLSMWGSYDHFVAVAFDSGAKLDIATNGLEYINEKEVAESTTHPR